MSTGTSQSSTKACTCGNQACAVREARSLRPFCQIPASNTKREGFGSYAEAARQRNDGQVIRAAHTPGSGSPKRFVLVTV